MPIRSRTRPYAAGEAAWSTGTTSAGTKRQDHQGELPGVREHDDVVTTSWPELTIRIAAPLEELADLVDVAGHPGDQRAAPLGLLVQHRQVVHVPERPGPQAGQGGLADR